MTVDDREAYEYYADPAHREAAGPPRKHPKDMLTAVLNVRVSPALLSRVTARAAAEGRSAGFWVRRALWLALMAEERPHAVPRPEGLIEDAGRRGEPKALRSSLETRRSYGYAATITLSGNGRTFTCPHFSIGNAVSASCEQCGPLVSAA